MSAGEADAWADHRDRTRRAILEAFVTMLHEDNPATVSMPAVADRAGISVRTLYRYFASKDDLMVAASGWFDVEAREVLGDEPIAGGNLREYLRALWALLHQNVPAVRAQHTGGPGRELRQRRLERTRADLTARVPDTIAPDRRDDLVDVLVAVTSSSMFLELVDRMGHPPRHAADLAAHVIDLILADATANVTAASTIHPDPIHPDPIEPDRGATTP